MTGPCISCVCCKNNICMLSISSLKRAKFGYNAQVSESAQHLHSLCAVICTESQSFDENIRLGAALFIIKENFFAFSMSECLLHNKNNNNNSNDDNNQISVG